MREPGKSLVLVRTADAREPTPAGRVAALQAEARSAVSDHVGALQEAFRAAEALAREVSEGGDLYPNAVRQLASRVAGQLRIEEDTVGRLMERARS